MEDKERHSSGESVDSCFSQSPTDDDASYSKIESTNDEADDESGDNLNDDLTTRPIQSKKEKDEKQGPQTEEESAELDQPARGILKRCIRRCFSESHAVTSQESTNDNQVSWIATNFDDSIPESSSSELSDELNDKTCQTLSRRSKNSSRVGIRFS